MKGVTAAIFFLIMAIPLFSVSTLAESFSLPFSFHGRGLVREENAKVKKGDRCNAEIGNICPGLPAKRGTQLLQCCKGRCRNVLSDRNHCGNCGKKCKFLELCCAGKCVSAAADRNNCGECGNKCAAGVPCSFGVCGYA